MKYFLYLSLIAIMGLYACGGGPSADDEDSGTNKRKKEKVRKSDDDKDVKEIANCSQFLDEYEEWVDVYLEFLEDYTKNPMDPNLAQKYAEIGQEASDWYVKWTSLYACASREKYQKRFEQIAKKIEKKMEELEY